MVVLKFEDIDIENIIFCKALKKNNNFSINCFYKKDNIKTPLILQTPDIYIPYDVSNKYTTCLEISFNDDIIKNFILKIEKKVLEMLKNKNISSVFKSNLKEKGNFDRLKLYVENETKTFDINKQIYTGNLSRTYGKVLINLSHIWSTEQFCGISWKVLQIQVYPKAILNEFSFLDDKPKEIEIPEIYCKMIKANVPLMAIKHKMELDNVDPDIINKLDNKNKCDFVPKKTIINKLDLTSVKLKKVTNQKKKKIEKIEKNIQVPTLNQIKNGLKNLKSIKK